MRRGRPFGYRCDDLTKTRISDTMMGRKRTKAERDAISSGRKKAYENKYKHYEDLLLEYKDNKEVTKWLKENKKNLSSENFEDVLSTRELRNSARKFVSFNENYINNDTTEMDPETLYMIREDIDTNPNYEKCQECGDINIPLKDTDWGTICFSCYEEALNKRYTK